VAKTSDAAGTLPSAERRATGAFRRRWLPALAGGVALVCGVTLLDPGLLPWSLPLLFVVVPAAQFALTPVWRRSGVYRYRSRVLFTVRRGAREMELHGGTLYDYVVGMRWADRGLRATRELGRGYLVGLLGVIADVEAGRIAADTRITGTSYFFSERTMRKLGFGLQPAGFLDRLHLLLDGLSLTAMYSYSRGRFAVPRIRRARRAVTTAAELARHRPEVERALARLDENRPPPGGRGPGNRRSSG